MQFGTFLQPHISVQNRWRWFNWKDEVVQHQTLRVTDKVFIKTNKQYSLAITWLLTSHRQTSCSFEMKQIAAHLRLWATVVKAQMLTLILCHSLILETRIQSFFLSFKVTKTQPWFWCCCVTEDKRRSVADFRDSSALHGREISSISVKALSALYLSKVAAAEPAGNLFKPVSTCSCFYSSWYMRWPVGSERWVRVKQSARKIFCWRNCMCKTFIADYTNDYILAQV